MNNDDERSGNDDNDDNGLLLVRQKVFLTSLPLSLSTLVDFVTHQHLPTTTVGAIATFLGIPRRDKADLVALDYQAYRPMALKKLSDVAVRVARDQTVSSIAIAHRIGTVPLGEASIIIAASAPHRREALRAVEQAIDLVKQTVPIWKKERLNTSSSSSSSSREPSWLANE